MTEVEKKQLSKLNKSLIAKIREMDPKLTRNLVRKKCKSDNKRAKWEFGYYTFLKFRFQSQ